MKEAKSIDEDLNIPISMIDHAEVAVAVKQLYALSSLFQVVRVVFLRT